MVQRRPGRAVRDARGQRHRPGGPRAGGCYATELFAEDKGEATVFVPTRTEADHALRVDGPVRESYLVYRRDTADENAWRTEIGWPVFSTGAAV